MSYGPLESEAHSVIRGMDFMGHEEFLPAQARLLHPPLQHERLPHHRLHDLRNRLASLDGGRALPALSRRQLAARGRTEVERVVEWIVRQTDKTKRSEAEDSRAPEYGLMPPGVLADWNSFAYHYTMNAYYFAALRQVGTALSDLATPSGKPVKVGRAVPSAPGERVQRRTLRTPADARGALGTARPTPELFRQDASRDSATADLALASAAELRTNILQSYRWTQAQAPALPLRNGTWIPHYPSQVHSPGKLADFFPARTAGRAGAAMSKSSARRLVPSKSSPPTVREVERILDHMEDVRFLSDGVVSMPPRWNREGLVQPRRASPRSALLHAQRRDTAFVVTLKPLSRSSRHWPPCSTREC